MGKPVKHYGKWRVRWVDQDGNRRSEVCATHADATHNLRQHQIQAEEVRRGYRTPITSGKLFGELCEYWLDNRAKYKRSRKDDLSMIKTHLRQFFGQMLVLQVTSERIDRFSQTLDHLNVKTKFNILTLLISLLNEAKRLNWLIEVPSVRKPKINMFNRDFRYLKTAEEIKIFLEVARRESPLAFTLYAAAVYTGMRQGELAGLKWADIDFERRLISVRRSFDGPTKGGEDRFIPILDALLPILRQWRLACPGTIVFPNQAGVMQNKGGRVFRDIFHRVIGDAGFPTHHSGNTTKRYIVFHDLRHTFASHWVMQGGDIIKLQKILGHTVKWPFTKFA